VLLLPKVSTDAGMIVTGCPTATQEGGHRWASDHTSPSTERAHYALLTWKRSTTSLRTASCEALPVLFAMKAPLQCMSSPLSLTASRSASCGLSASSADAGVPRSLMAFLHSHRDVHLSLLVQADSLANQGHSLSQPPSAPAAACLPALLMQASPHL